MFWRDKAGRGWYWESEDLGEHRLFSRSGDLAARLNERGGRKFIWKRKEMASTSRFFEK
jgi:hypothetical protein